MNFELLDFIANVLDHFIQLVEVLLMKSNDVSQKISLLLLSLNGSFQFGNWYGVVGGKRECSSSSDKRSNVPMASLTFRYMGKACQKILKKI